MGERRRARRLALLATALVAAVALSACVRVTHPAPAPPPPPPAPPAPPPAPSGTFSGLGFDACAAPTSNAMQAWLASPYRALGVYIGGATRACSQPNLNASWVSTVASEGWHLAPLYVGLQSPCAFQGGLQAIDPNNAPAQGVASADDAANDAAALGLGGGTPIYFDMEGYDTTNSSCVAVVRSFVNYWVTELHNRGYVAGFYSSVLAGVNAEASVVGNPNYFVPDDIWFAHWNNQASVFGDPYLSDSLWADHQRIHQYHGGHDESWGGVVINIDNNVFDVRLAT